jgi:hypothetical protein
MQVKIKSITPQVAEGSESYGFLVEVEPAEGGESKTLQSMTAERVLDYQKCRVEVARQAGWLLKIGGGRDDGFDWETMISQAWRDSESLADLQEEWEANRKHDPIDPDD